jgi:hypothetical protein
VRKGFRVLLADKEISLAGTGFQTDLAEGRWRALEFAHEGWCDLGRRLPKTIHRWQGFEELAMPLFDSLYNCARWLVDTSNDAEDLGRV